MKRNNSASGCKRQSNSLGKRTLRPRLEYKEEEGFVESEVKKALLESIYEQRKRDRRKELEEEEREKKEEEKRRRQRKEEKKDPNWLPSTRDFVRFISLNYTNDIDDLPDDLRQFHSLPLEHIPMPTDPEK